MNKYFAIVVFLVATTETVRAQCSSCNSCNSCNSCQSCNQSCAPQVIWRPVPPRQTQQEQQPVDLQPLPPPEFKPLASPPPVQTPPIDSKPSIDWAAYDAQQKAIADAQKKLTDQGEQSLVVLNQINQSITNQKGCQCDNSKLEAKIDALATAVANINVAQPTTPPVQPIVQPPAPAPVANGAPAFFLKLRPHKEN